MRSKWYIYIYIYIHIYIYIYIYIYIIFYKIYPLGLEIIILNNISLSKDFWSFNYGVHISIKITSNFFLRCFCEGAEYRTFHFNTCSMFLLMCWTGFDFWSGFLCSDQQDLQEYISLILIRILWCGYFYVALIIDGIFEKVMQINRIIFFLNLF